ncbi:MAG: hypothetical protein ACK4HE_07735 [Chitinophagaceae bacterium]
MKLFVATLYKVLSFARKGVIEYNLTVNGEAGAVDWAELSKNPAKMLKMISV